MPLIRSCVRRWNTITSSIRLRNSGRNVLRRASMSWGIALSMSPEDVADCLAADIGCHDDHGVFKINRAAFPVCEPSVVQDLEHDVEDIRMGFFDLVKQQNGIGPATDSLRQIPALFVSDIARGRADQARHRMFLHVLRHVDTHHGVFIIEKELGQGFCKLGFPDTGGAEKYERSHRPPGILQACPCASDRIRYGSQRIILSQYALAQAIFHVNQFLNLSFQHLA